MFRRTKTANQADSAGFDEDMVVVVDQSVNPYLVMFHEPAGYRAEQVRGLRNRLVAVYADKGYGAFWQRESSNEPQLKMGINFVVFALTQKGSIAQQQIDFYSQ